MFREKIKSSFFILLCLCLLLLSGSLVYGKKTDTLDQTTRLSALAKVWGLLKYYHPEVAKGEIDWDAVLISAIPAVKTAGDFDSFNQEINNLILEAGDVNPAHYNPGVPAHPNKFLFKWIKDHSIFNNKVIKKLKTVQKKHVPAENYYVQAAWNQGNTTFENEKKYDDTYYPDENYRLLALIRYWNVIQYFFPYKDVMDENWEEILEEFVPRFIEVDDLFEYHLLVNELASRINDGHGFCSSQVVNYYFGNFYGPFEIRYIQDKTVVTRVFSQMLDDEDQVKVGDIIIQKDGKDILDFRNDVRKYAGGSNENDTQTIINDFVLRGRSSQLEFTFLRGSQVRNVSVPAYYYYLIYEEKQVEDSQLERWKILPGNIGYVHMGLLEKSDVDQAMTELNGTDGIIFDLRYYPAFILYNLGNYLFPNSTPFSLVYYPVLDYPGEFDFGDPLEVGMDNPDYYRGKVVILVDEQTMSRAEFTCMALQASPNATVIGSQTSGSDGDVSYIDLPGGIQMYFSGIGIFYPDGGPTQRIGIVPDIEKRPTVTGIQQGLDEVLDRAIQFIENN
jgi:C-terminal processing protease CtpA/Prc